MDVRTEEKKTEKKAQGQQERDDSCSRLTAGITLMDGCFLRAFFRARKDLAELILRVILDKPALEVLDSDIRYVPIYLSDIFFCMDVVATEPSGMKYYIGLLWAEDGLDPKDVRAACSALDMRVAATGPEEDLAESYLFFITRDDIFLEGRGIYTIDRYRRSDDPAQCAPFDDGFHIIYINGAYRGHDDLGRLMRSFSCSDPEDMDFPELRDRAMELKRGGKSADLLLEMLRDGICEDLKKEFLEENFKKGYEEGYEKGYEEGFAEGVELGLEKSARETSSYLYANGFQVAEIAEAVRFSVDVVRDWLRHIS